MINKKLVLGFIGNGKSTNRYHLPFVLKRPDQFIVKTIYNPRIHHDIWKKIDGITYTENIDDVIKDDEIDMVVVCTAHQYHYYYTKMILEAGKHCLCEKPFMETYQQAKEIFDLAKEKGLYCSAYQNRRYDSDFLTVQKVIESGKLGELLELEMHFDYYRPEIPESIHEFSPAMSYLYGHGCHTLDQVISYFGKPDRIHYDVRQLLILTFEKPASSAGFRSALRAGVGAVMSPLYPASFSTPCVTPFYPRIPLLHTPRKNAPQPRRAAGPGCLSACRPVRSHRAHQAGNRLRILT